MYNQVITLVTETDTLDEYGDVITTTTQKNVFAQVKSIGMSEKYQADAVGLKPEIKFVLSDWLEYDNQKRVLFADFGEETQTEYSVIRTYRNGNTLEITCQRGIYASA